MPEREEMIRAGSLAFRRRLPPMQEPPYSMASVKPPERDLSGTVVTKLTGRAAWLAQLPEMLLLCNEASKRQFRSKHAANGNKPLSLEYMADRLDTDDPVWGMTVRDGASGEMHAYVTVTTFTTWVRWFRWDSLAELAGVNEFPKELDDLDKRVVDAESSLAHDLEVSVRDGDPDGEGVVWPHLAEISLLGGLGCGKTTLNLIIDDLEAPESQYDFVVLQATENAVPFYESQGFVRVGAVARYHDLDPVMLERRAQAERAEALKLEMEKQSAVLNALEEAPDHLAEASSSSSSSSLPPPSSSSGNTPRKGSTTSSAAATTAMDEDGYENGPVDEAGEPEEVLRLAEPFMTLPSREELPQYFEYTENPISLKEIRENVKSASYATMAAFESDLKVMFNNARRFNAVGSRLWLASESLERLAARKLAKTRTQQLVGDDTLSPELQAACAPDAFWRKLQRDLSLDARDSKRGHWYKAKVVEMDDELGRVKVHFQGWPKKWDEWYPKDSQDLQAAGTHTDQKPAVEEVLPADDQSLLTALAFRVLPKMTLKVTATEQESSKQLGLLRAGMVVSCTDRHRSLDGTRLERIFFEQTTNAHAPSKGWINLRGRSGELLLEPVKAEGLQVEAAPGVVESGRKNSSGKKRRRGATDDVDRENFLDANALGAIPLSLGQGAAAGCTECKWFVCKPDDTPTSVGERCGCSAFDIVFLNKQLYAGLTASSRMRGGTKIRVPRHNPKDAAAAAAAAKAESARRQPVWYTARENETPKMIAQAHGLDGHAGIINLNRKRFPELAPSSRLRRGTRLRLPRPKDPTSPSFNSEASSGAMITLDDMYYDACRDWEEDPEVVAYRHWTFPDDENIEDQAVSYMMARRLNRRKRGQGYGETTASINATLDFTSNSSSVSAAAAAAAAASIAAMDAAEADDKNSGDAVKSLSPNRARGSASRVSRSTPSRSSLSSSASASAKDAKNAAGGGGNSEPMSKDVVLAMEKAITAIKDCTDEGRKRADIFMDLPPKRAFPDYYQLIKHPICIHTIEKRVQASREEVEAAVKKKKSSTVSSSGGGSDDLKPYQTMGEFELEFQRLFDNARSYNLPKSEVYCDAEEMEVVFREVLAKENPTIVSDCDLFNKVVAVSPAADGTSLPYPLYFVLTYIPDLQWCRLSPLEKRGTFRTGPHSGQPKWMLVRGEHHEADVSALRCSVVKARAVRRTVDADEEEWVTEGRLVKTSSKKRDSSSGKGSNSKAKLKASSSTASFDEDDEDDVFEDDDAKKGSQSKAKSRSSTAASSKRSSSSDSESKRVSGNGNNTRPTAKRAKKSSTYSGDEDEEFDYNDLMEEEEQSTATNGDVRLSAVEELMNTAAPPAINKRALDKWGKAFLSFKVKIPSAVWGRVYASEALRLWKMESQTCRVTQFRPGDEKKGHRWEFEWRDPESTAIGTLDYKHLCEYIVTVEEAETNIAIKNGKHRDSRSKNGKNKQQSTKSASSTTTPTSSKTKGKSSGSKASMSSSSSARNEMNSRRSSRSASAKVDYSESDAAFWNKAAASKSDEEEDSAEEDTEIEAKDSSRAARSRRSSRR